MNETWEEAEKIGQCYEWLGKLRRFFILQNTLYLFFVSPTTILSRFSVAPSTAAMCRRWSFCTSLQMSPESGPESSPRHCLGQILRLLSTRKKRNIPDLVVIRIVRPHGQLQGVFATPPFILLHHSLCNSPCPSSSSPRRHSRIPWRRPPAIFLVTLKTTFNNVETKGSKSWVVLAAYRGILGNKQSTVPTKCHLRV